MDFKKLAQDKLDKISGFKSNINESEFDDILEGLDLEIESVRKIDENQIELDLDDELDFEPVSKSNDQSIQNLFDGYIGEKNFVPNPYEYGPNATYRNINEGIVYKKNSENLWEAFVKDGKSGQQGPRGFAGGGTGVEEVKKIATEIVNDKIIKQNTNRTIWCFGNSIMRQGCMPIDPVSATSANSAWVPNTFLNKDFQFSISQVELSEYFTAKYPKVTKEGITGNTEPLWYLYSPGDIIVDGSCEWTIYESNSGYVRFPGFWHWALQLAGQPVQETFLAGIGGIETPSIISNVNSALENLKHPGRIFFGPCWENDYGRARPLSEIQIRWDNWEAMLDYLRSKGISITICTPLPTKMDNNSGYVKGVSTSAFEWLLQKHYEYISKRNDVELIDWTNLYISKDPSIPVWPDQTTLYIRNNGSSGVGSDGYLPLAVPDGTHPGAYMHFQMAKIVAQSLKKQYSKYPITSIAGVGSNYQADPNPKFYGSGGTVSAPCSGVFSNYHRLFGINASAVSTKLVKNDGTIVNLISATNNVSGAGYVGFKYPSNLNLSGFKVGDIVQFEFKILVKANPVGFSKLSSSLNFIGSSAYTSISLDTLGTETQEIGSAIFEDTEFHLKSMPVKIPIGTTAFNLELNINMHGLNSNCVIEMYTVGIFNKSNKNLI